MSITGSLVGYENNNEISSKKNRSLLNITASSKQCPSLNSSISNSVITSSSASAANPKHPNPTPMGRKAPNGRRCHFNSLWSIWYGILMTLVTGYLAVQGAHRFLVCSLLQWKLDVPSIELNIQIILCGFVFLLLPIFFVTTIFKIGNLANDGIKLASGAGKCSVEPPDGLEEEAKGGTLRALWTHGGPTSAFLHVVAALALLVPRLLLEARMIENGLLPKEHIWRTELDFLVTHRDRLVILSFMTSPYQNNTPDGESPLITGTAGTQEEYQASTGETHLIEKFGTFDDEEDFFDNPTTSEVPEERHPVSSTYLPTVEPARRGRQRGAHRTSASYRRKQKGRKEFDDVDVNLELKPEKPLPFERLNNYDGGTVFEGRRKQQRKGAKDSNIHIVKPEKMPDGFIPSTPMTANSKIIEIKANKNATRRAKRSSDVVIQPSALIGAIPMNITLSEGNANLLIEVLQKLFGSAGREGSDPQKWISLPSLEFLNLAIAIMIWSVRYPAVFWGTSKSFATVFSVQMLANGVTILLDYVGCSVLYKLEMLEPPPPLRSPGLLLNATVTVSLFILSTILIMSSSLVLYLYGHGKLATKMRERKVISTKSGDTWSYFAHCASLCYVLALSVAKAPILHDLSITYKASLDRAVLVSALGSVVHLFLWVMLWLTLTAKRRWAFKLPPLEDSAAKGATEPLLMTSHRGGSVMAGAPGQSLLANSNGEETIYWPKLTPSSPKLKVTFNEVPSTSPPQNLGEHDGKRNKGRGASVCVPPLAGEADDGDYATLRGPTGDLLHLSDLTAHCEMADDNTSEEGKLLESVRDDSVTYASTRDLEPPIEQMVSPLAPVTVTVHTNEAHITSSSTPRCLRRADSGVPNEALTPRSDTTSTEESASPPDRAPSETSSGVHSGEERELSEVVIRPRGGAATKVAAKPVPPAIEEEPFGRSTNMRMSSFAADGLRASSATLPLTRAISEPPMLEFPHCSTMPLPVGCHQQIQGLRQHSITPNSQSKTQLLQHTTLPNGVRQFTQNQFLRRLPHVRTAESPYGILGLGSGHHTFSKLLHEPLTAMPIPEDRDSANYSIISEQDIYISH